MKLVKFFLQLLYLDMKLVKFCLQLLYHLGYAPATPHYNCFFTWSLVPLQVVSCPIIDYLLITIRLPDDIERKDDKSIGYMFLLLLPTNTDNMFSYPSNILLYNFFYVY
jgi:hypothetical protein